MDGRWTDDGRTMDGRPKLNTAHPIIPPLRTRKQQGPAFMAEHNVSINYY